MRIIDREHHPGLNFVRDVLRFDGNIINIAVLYENRQFENRGRDCCGSSQKTDHLHVEYHCE